MRMGTLTFGSLFSGIGGLDIGLESTGMVCRWQVENNDYCIKVLEKHWPNTKRYGDIYELDKRTLESVDLVCGGGIHVSINAILEHCLRCPCNGCRHNSRDRCPIVMSSAGKQDCLFRKPGKPRSCKAHSCTAYQEYLKELRED